MMFFERFPDEFEFECRMKMDEEDYDFWFGETNIVDILGYINIKNLSVNPARPLDDFLLYDGERYAVLYVSPGISPTAAGTSQKVSDFYVFDTNQLKNVREGRHRDTT